MSRVIGVDKYPFLSDACSGHACDLRYPVDDATEFLKVVAQKSAPLFSSMETLVLVNREALDESPDKAQQTYTVASADNIMEPDSHTIDDQLADFLDKPGEHDTTIIFVAGHGINIDEDYYFIPTDGRKQDADRWKRSSLVDWGDIQKSVERAKGMRFMLLDTCHAANAFNPRLEKDAQDARIVVFLGDRRPTTPPPNCRNLATASSPIRSSKACAARREPRMAASRCSGSPISFRVKWCG